MKNKYIFLITILLSASSSLYSLNYADSLKVYQLGDISVTGAFAKSKIAQSNINTLNYFVLQRSDVRSASELQLYIPSGKIRTNSRGESMLFLRGAGERQLGIFFDGVPLNVAWDNRFDLSMLPVDIIGKIDVNKNANSIMFGPNVMGGAVNISTVERVNDGLGANVRFQAGEAGLLQESGTIDGRYDDFNFIASFSYSGQDGNTLSANRPDSMTNQDINSSLRNNTDREFASFYTRGEYELSENSKLGLSLLHITGSKGVAAETHIEPSAARFWRFPLWERTIIASNGEFSLTQDNSLVLRSTFWYDLFNQNTDSYSDMYYTQKIDKQVDKDRTGGARIAVNWSFGNNQNISYALNFYNLNHSEQIKGNSESLYSQNVFSNGLSYNWYGDLFDIRAGVVYDLFMTGDAGVFKEAEGKQLGDYGAFIGLKYLLTDNLVAYTNFSRRTRFPTMREAYSGALDRFVTNPDLKPETGILTEIGISQIFENFSYEIAGFASFYDDLIEQIRFTKEQDSLRRRMRVNYSKATIVGADLTIRSTPIKNAYIEANFTYLNTSGEQNGNKVEYIDNRPEFLLGIIANYKFSFGLSIQGEVEGVGKQYERNPEDQAMFVEIGATSIFNLRLAYQLPMLHGILSEIYIRGNNLLDTYRISQLGLPETGRLITAGINLNI